MSGSVDDVDAVILPETGGGRRSDGDTPLLLLHHPVHRGRAVMHFTQLVRLACVEKNPFGRRGLSCINVRHDTDITGHFKGTIS